MASSFNHLDPAYRKYVSYIDKSREFYQAHGYENAYRWSTNTNAAFSPLGVSLAEATVGVITTSSFHREAASFSPGDPPASKQAFAAPVASAPSAMFTEDLSWHKEATNTDDLESFLPLGLLQDMADEGTIGALSERFYGVPTEYSKTKTAADQDKVLDWCRQDGVDVALLIPL